MTKKGGGGARVQKKEKKKKNPQRLWGVPVWKSQWKSRIRRRKETGEEPANQRKRTGKCHSPKEKHKKPGNNSREESGKKSRKTTLSAERRKGEAIILPSKERNRNNPPTSTCNTSAKQTSRPARELGYDKRTIDSERDKGNEREASPLSTR